MRFRLNNKMYYGWVIVAAFLVIQAMLIGVNSTFTIFFTHIENAFSLTRTTTSAISSVSWVLIPLTAFAGGWAMDRYGPRKVVLAMGIFAGLSLILTSRTTEAWQLFFTYSLLLSMGFGAIYAVSISIISRWFDKKRGLATGIAGSGEGVGTVVMAPLSTFLIGRFDWKTAYLVLGIIVLAIVLPLSRLVKKDPGEVGLLADGVRPVETESIEKKPGLKQSAAGGSTLMDIIKTGSFWTGVGIWFFFAFCMLMIVTHIVPHMTDLGVSAGDSAAIVGIIGATRAIGMISMGVVADKVGRRKVAVISTIIQAVTIIWLIWAQELWMLYLFAAIFGLSNGGLYSGITPLLGDTFGLNRLGSVLGLLEIGWGIGSAAGQLTGGFIYDSSGSYLWAFVLASVSMLVVVLLVIVLRPVKLKKFVNT